MNPHIYNVCTQDAAKAIKSITVLVRASYSRRLNSFKYTESCLLFLIVDSTPSGLDSTNEASIPFVNLKFFVIKQKIERLYERHKCKMTLTVCDVRCACDFY